MSETELTVISCPVDVTRLAEDLRLLLNTADGLELLQEEIANHEQAQDFPVNIDLRGA